MTKESGACSGFNRKQYIPKICICKIRNEEFAITLFKMQKKWLIVAAPMTDMTKPTAIVD